MPWQKQNNRKIIIGVTGSFGSGKTLVSSMLKSFGAQVIDADSIARKLTLPRRRIYKKIVKVFGCGIIGADKAIKRRELARIVFADKVQLAKLNRIVHPEVIRQIKNEIKAAKKKVIVLDAPLLIEVGLKKIVDQLIVVKASQDKQLDRVMRRTTLTRAEILKRIKAQISLVRKARLADFIIDNNGTILKTKKQVKNVWGKITGGKCGKIGYS